MPKRWLLALGVIVLMAGIAAALYLRPTTTSRESVAAHDQAKDSDNTDEKQASVPLGSQANGAEAPKLSPTGASAATPLRDPATGQPILPSKSPQAASVAEAFRTHQHPERLSMLVPVKPFDKIIFEADPEKYLRVIEPGRVQQCKQPGKDVSALKAKGEHQFLVKPDGKVILEVRGAKLAPATFLSVDGGRFLESDLNCVTVRADAQGVAKATFLASFGADGDVNILVGSPEASGQVRFVVTVEHSPLRRADEVTDKSEK